MHGITMSKIYCTLCNSDKISLGEMKCLTCNADFKSEDVKQLLDEANEDYLKQMALEKRAEG